MSEETKQAKFKLLLDETLDWLIQNRHRTSCYGEGGSTGPYKGDFVFDFSTRGVVYRVTFFDGYTSNPYVSILKKMAGNGEFYCFELRNDVVELCKESKKSEADNSRYSIIFLMLLMAALDDEIYNNELDSIIDIAYSMNFTEAMIRDWCRAVEYVMQGNRFQEGCEFECETQEGAQFFLHKDNSTESPAQNSVLSRLSAIKL